jgi:hypothetical protein
MVSFDLDITLNVIIFPGENMTGRIEELFQVHSDYLTGCMCLSYLNLTEVKLSHYRLQKYWYRNQG